MIYSVTELQHYSIVELILADFVMNTKWQYYLEKILWIYAQSLPKNCVTCKILKDRYDHNLV